MDTTTKLEIKQRRSFSEQFKQAKVKELIEKRLTIHQLCQLYDVSRTSVYKWLYKYSPHHHQKTTLVVQMESEAFKTQQLLQRIAELERAVGQKQLEIDFLNKLLELGSEELGFDLKKKFQCQVFEWFRHHRQAAQHSYTMKQLYVLTHLSKQAHHQGVQRLRSQAQKEEVYVRLMEEVRSIHPGMGLRTMYDMAQPDGIGRDAFIALGLREGFRLRALEKHTRTTYSVKTNRYTNLLDGRRFTAVNQLWSSDITYVYCLNRFYYLVMIMDVYSRRIIGYSVADNMRAENNFSALQMALELRGITDYEHRLIHHSDKGSQYASDLYTDTLDDHGISISMCEEVYENTHIERVNDTIKNQYLLRMDIGSERQLHQKVARVIEVYNTQRPHQSLPQKMTPVAYEHYLPTVALTDRIKMQIFTVQKDAQHEDPNQLKLVFS